MFLELSDEADLSAKAAHRQVN